MKYRNFIKKPVTTALLLAAGMGNRLHPLTRTAPKCLTKVNGTPILERLVISLNQHGFKRLVVITGHLENRIRGVLGNQVGDISIEYVFSPFYNTTNNIYSLWLAKKAINEPFLLLESDLIFDESLLKAMRYPDRIAVAMVKPWMNGTCVTIDNSGYVKAFHSDNSKSFGETKYKTVNIYSISLSSWHRIVKNLDKRIADGEVNDYYETTFAEMIAGGDLSLKMVSFEDKPWYEIDTMEDLVKAEKLFLSNPYGNYTIPKTDTATQTGIFRMPLFDTAAKS